MADKYSISAAIKRIDKTWWKLMNAQQLKAMAASPFVIIGSHTHAHYDLTSIVPDSLQEELNLSKKLAGSLHSATGAKHCLSLRQL